MDANHAAIVQALRKIGAKVTDLSAVGKGVPDILVWFRDCWTLLEIKVPGGKLNELQATWHAVHKDARVFVVMSEDEAISAVQRERG